ncbi:MAG TPA: hypothetical protein VK680_03335 [Solirubrobacteraceae bacterium]|jgi:hypothetical protein|nr:hypothetical protein [Solirubrobacteraceae bacterium]
MPRTKSTSQSPRRRKSLLLAIAATLILLTVGVATAMATSSIEGVWSFTGGQIAVESAGNGKFKGIVVQPTKFATCTHPVGQEIWKEITPQADGSYWGFHQWYKSNEETRVCVENPVLGPTAWRVVTEANGSSYLLVCLSSPGAKQPTIPPGSPGVGASYGCEKSLLTAPLARSAVGSFKEVVSLPSAKKCFSGRKFNIHIHDSKYDPFKTVVVTLRGHKLKIVHRDSTYVATVNLKGLPAGAFTIKIKATTFRGNQVSGKRTYHTCAAKPKKSKPAKLKK